MDWNHWTIVRASEFYWRLRMLGVWRPSSFCLGCPMGKDRHDITEMLARFADSRAAADALLPLIYDQLRAMAEAQLRRERADHTLDATALVHEAYFKLIDQRNATWQNRAHFLAIASQAMRRVLINYAHQHRAKKRGGDHSIVTFSEQGVPRDTRIQELLELDQALGRLAALSERQARVVECRFFGGLKHKEIAEVLGLSEASVRRDWRLARAWLNKELSRD
jgi:RNA polymerase sigma factor (TIGR02999 family)